MSAASLLAGLATEDTANAVLQKTTDLLTTLTGQASPTAAQIAAAIRDVQPNDYALNATLTAVLNKQIANPATDASSQQIVSGLSGLATQTTQAAILAKLPSVPATDAPHSATAPGTVVTGSGLTASQTASDAQLLVALLQVLGTASGLPHTDSAALLTAVQALGTQTTSAAILAKLSGDPATQTTLASVLSKLSSDPATQTTLAAVLAKLPSAPALDSSLQSVLTALGTGSATGLAKLEDTARVSGDRGTPVLGVRGTTTPTARTDAAGDYGFMQVDAEGRQVITQHAIPELTWQAYAALTTTTAVALAAARGTGIRNYLRSLVISASQPSTAVAHIVSVLDGTTVIHRQQIPAAITNTAVVFDPPLRGSAATALNVSISAANSAGTAVTATGYQGL